MVRAVGSGFCSPLKMVRENHMIVTRVVVIVLLILIAWCMSTSMHIKCTSKPPWHQWPIVAYIRGLTGRFWLPTVKIVRRRDTLHIFNKRITIVLESNRLVAHGQNGKIHRSIDKRFVCKIAPFNANELQTHTFLSSVTCGFVPRLLFVGAVRKFPVNDMVICMEQLDTDMRGYIQKQLTIIPIINALTNLLQKLIYLQKNYNFLHNDLHLKNIMIRNDLETVLIDLDKVSLQSCMFDRHKDVQKIVKGLCRLTLPAVPDWSTLKTSLRKTKDYRTSKFDAYSLKLFLNAFSATVG